MWHRNTKVSKYWKMAPRDFLMPSYHGLLICKKTQYQWSTIKWNATKWGVPVLKYLHLYKESIHVPISTAHNLLWYSNFYNIFGRKKILISILSCRWGVRPFWGQMLQLEVWQSDHLSWGPGALMWREGYRIEVSKAEISQLTIWDGKKWPQGLWLRL